jgi:hypothetical protein
VEPRNGSVILQTKRGIRSTAGAGGDRVGVGLGGDLGGGKYSQKSAPS